jgi:hypothetical protein
VGGWFGACFPACLGDRCAIKSYLVIKMILWASPPPQREINPALAVSSQMVRAFGHFALADRFSANAMNCSACLLACSRAPWNTIMVVYQMALYSKCVQLKINKGGF